LGALASKVALVAQNPLVLTVSDRAYGTDETEDFDTLAEAERP